MRRPIQVLNAALTACARASKWQLCLHLLPKPYGLSADAATFGIAISAIQRGRVFWGWALVLLTESERASVNQTSVYNAAISTVGATGKWRLSVQLLQGIRNCLQDFQQHSTDGFQFWLHL